MSTSKFARCPECQTTFRVTPQQLTLRDGQVRCGRCRSVFNAYSALVDPKGLRIPGPGMTPAETNTMTLRDFVAVKEEADATTPETEPKTPAAHLLADLESKKQVEKGEEKPAEQPPKPEASEKITLMLVEDTISRLSQMSQQATPSVLSGAETTSTGSTPSVAIKSGKKKRRNKKDPTPMAVVLDSDTPNLWRKLGLPKWGRPIFYGFGFSILTIGLWAQTVFYFHDLLAYQYPGARSFLEASCRVLNCRIAPYRDLDMLSIDSSELHSLPDLPQRLALTTTIRNRGKQPVAYPLLQFELTDTQDKVSGRRYFAPDVYLDNTAHIAQGLAGNRDVTFTLQLESHLDTASGYRLSLVYPAS